VDAPFVPGEVRLRLQAAGVARQRRFVFRPQMPEQMVRRRQVFAPDEEDGRARLHQQQDTHRRLRGREVGDLLRDSVLLQPAETAADGLQRQPQEPPVMRFAIPAKRWISLAPSVASKRTMRRRE